MAAENPLLSDSLFPRFDAVQASDVVPGVRHVLAESERELQELEKSLEGLGAGVTVQFLLPALEKLTDRLGKTWGICTHLKAVKDSEQMRKAIEEVQPDKVAFGLKVSQSEPVFRAYKHIRDSAAWPTLSEAQHRIVESGIREAELAGVALTGANKERFNEIQKRLAQLSTDFSNNVLDATKAFSVRLTTKEEVDGLPPSALALAAQSAKSKGDEAATPENGPWLITLDIPAYMPVMQYAKDRSLREKLYKAYITRASDLGISDGSKSIDNTPLIKEILELRKEKAALLGKKHHAVRRSIFLQLKRKYCTDVTRDSCPGSVDRVKDGDSGDSDAVDARFARIVLYRGSTGAEGASGLC
jgi:oligopeptidase A